MLAAALDDFCRVPGVEVRTILSPFMRDHVTVGGLTDRLAALGLVVDWTLDEGATYRAGAAAEDYALVVAPEFDGILEARCRAAVDSGSVLLGPSPEAVALTADKLLLARHFQRHGVRTPETYPEYDVDLSNWPTPFVVKHRLGAGSDEMLICTDPATARDVFDEAGGLGDLIVQPLIPGLPASVSLLIGPRRIHALPPSEQFVSVAGNFRYLGGRAPLPEPLADRALRLARQAIDCVPGLNGYIGVDVILGRANDGSDDYVIEINPRLTTSFLGLRALCEDNLMDLLLRLVRGESVAKPSWRRSVVTWSPDGNVEVIPPTTDIATP
jgi:predicted ATP-grasp superfamily ATP-dependent carboligase